MKKRLLFVFAGIFCLSTTNVFAQNKGKGLAHVVEAALTRQAVKQLPKDVVYHPVFGYIRPVVTLPGSHVAPLTPFTAASESTPTPDRPVQTQPLLTPVQKGKLPQGFVRLKDITDAQLTQTIYLWRLANPENSLYITRYGRFLLNKAQERLDQVFSSQSLHGGLDQIEQLPNLLFLQHLRQTDTPTSYAKLAEVTMQYPKYITLNKFGFPVKTADADYADVLDNYLLLSNPREMGAFNNASKGYTPFTLTPQEHAAADELLSLRRQSEKLPENPSARDLLAMAYNRLETHTVKYTKVGRAGLDYKAYPNYKNTQLYRTINGVLAGQRPRVAQFLGYNTLENTDMTHLIVLHAVMGGIDPLNYEQARLVLDAFVELCAEVHPKDSDNIEHLVILQQNLRRVFAPLMQEAFARKNFITWHDFEEDTVDKAWSLLNNPSRVYELAGMNWTSHD